MMMMMMMMMMQKQIDGQGLGLTQWCQQLSVMEGQEGI